MRAPRRSRDLARRLITAEARLHPPRIRTKVRWPSKYDTSSSEPREITEASGAERKPETDAIAAGAEGLRAGSPVEGSESGQVGGLPERDALSEGIGDENALPVEGRAVGPVQAVAGQGRQDGSVRSPDHRDRAALAVGHPDVRAVEDRIHRCGTNRHRLKNGCARVELQELVGVGDPDVGAVVQSARGKAESGRDGRDRVRTQ